MDAHDTLARLRGRGGLIRLHGHRGARGIMPENTMAGFDFALSCGVGAIEFDVLFARDGTPVLTHNPHLAPDLTRDKSGAWLEEPTPLVRELDVAALQEYDVGGVRARSLYGARFPEQAFLNGAHIPTLAELAAVMARPAHAAVWLNLEIKSNPEHPDLTPPLAQMVASTLAVLRAHDLCERTLVQSFDWRVLKEVAVQAPRMPRSFLSELPGSDDQPSQNVYAGSPWMAGLRLEDHAGSLPRLVRAAGGQVWSPYFKDLTMVDVREAHDLGLVVNTWTVNNPKDIDRIIELGVDGIITDYPGRVQQRLMSYGLSWSD